jgi:hypothetical protein
MVNEEKDSETVDGLAEDEEDMAARHRKEKKQLQAKIQVNTRLWKDIFLL